MGGTGHREGGEPEGIVRVGVISDTHGQLRPEVFDVFRDVDHLLHAGDVGNPEILTDLGALAPVDAVHGNMDRWSVRERTEATVERTLAGVRIAMTHGHLTEAYDQLPERFPGAEVVVYGHTHQPAERRVGATLLLNPGSAGPRRPGKPVTVALLVLEGGSVQARFYDLEEGGKYRPGP